MKKLSNKLKDGKLHVPSMNKKFFVLTAESNGEDILEKDGVYYFTGRAAERVCKEKGYKLLENKEEVEKFIDTFKGKTQKDKIMDFVKTFGLTKSGYWLPNNKGWYYVGSVGFALVSRVNPDDHVYGVERINGGASIYRNDQKYPSPFVACEDCSSEADSSLSNTSTAKKVNTKYVINIGDKTVNLEVNEEYPDHMKVEICQDRWRSKAEHINLYKTIIKELESFTP